MMHSHRPPLIPVGRWQLESHSQRPQSQIRQSLPSRPQRSVSFFISVLCAAQTHTLFHSAFEPTFLTRTRSTIPMQRHTSLAKYARHYQTAVPSSKRRAARSAGLLPKKRTVLSKLATRSTARSGLLSSKTLSSRSRTVARRISVTVFEMPSLNSIKLQDTSRAIRPRSARKAVSSFLCAQQRTISSPVLAVAISVLRERSGLLGRGSSVVAQRASLRARHAQRKKRARAAKRTAGLGSSSARPSP